jgi:DNA-binding Lrp family transcriptional regulator
MKTNTSKKIIEYIQEKGRATPNDLVGYLSISPQAVFKHLRKLVEKKILTKTGRPPKVYYAAAADLTSKKIISIEPVLEKTIEENFLTITPSGESKPGMEGFIHWCNKFNLPIQKTAREYQRTLKKYEAHKMHGLINGMDKFKNTFNKVYLNKVFYLDFYAIERFGKTKLGQWLLFAKQGQDRKLIRALTETIKPQVDIIIRKHDIDGVGFIPPTIKREIQFMKEMQRNLDLAIKTISIVKLKPPIIVPQKTLNKLSDRIENAKKTIVVNEEGHYKNILLIDDAVGSGATFNETAAQIRDKEICDGKIIGLAITGSYKGFDVISEI